jgi:hypothetical protein
MCLINEADADDGGEEKEVADDKGGDVVGGPRQLGDLVHDQPHLKMRSYFFKEKVARDNSFVK